jgi:hypothetical protein
MHRCMLVITCLMAVSLVFSCDAAATQSQTASTTTVPTSTASTSSIPTSITSTASTTPTSTTSTPGKVSLEKLVEIADYIITGQVTNIVKNQQIDGVVYTLVTFLVEQNIKGETGPEVTIRIQGGEIGGIGMMATDNAAFHAEEKAVVFLASVEGYFTVVGGLYGKVTIDENNMAGGMPLAEYIDQVKKIYTQN